MFNCKKDKSYANKKVLSWCLRWLDHQLDRLDQKYVVQDHHCLGMCLVCSFSVGPQVTTIKLQKKVSMPFVFYCNLDEKLRFKPKGASN